LDDNNNLDNRLNRDIGRLGYSAINLNSVIGAGIFGLPAAAAARTGAFSPWVFVLAGLLIFTVVLSFARASSMFRETGGVITFASHAFGPFVGFQTGWLAYLSRAVSMGANTNLLVTYASWLWAPLDVAPGRPVALIVIFTALTWLNVVGVKNSVGALYVFTILKLLPLSLLVLFGLGHVDLQMLISADLPDIGVLGEAVLLVMYAYVGFEGTVVPAGEGRNPRRDLPGALIHTILLIGVIYILVQVVSMAALPDLGEHQGRAALADVAGALLGPIGALVLTLGAVFSIAGNLTGSILSAPRMTFALARDGSMPAWFSSVHARHHTPYASIVVYGGLSLAIALSGTFIYLAVISTLVRLLTYMVCIAALPILEKTTEAHEGQFRLAGGLFIPIVAFALCLWLITYASAEAWVWTSGFFLVGSALYAFSRWQARNRREGRIPVPAKDRRDIDSTGPSP
jgi:APA family basic amino acid/polyamine antiporter